MNRGFETTRTANDRVRIETFSIWKSWKVRFLLTKRYGFKRSGRSISALPDETIHKDFVRNGLKIVAGWNNWVGYYWSADNKETDVFLNYFYSRYCVSDART